MRLEKLKSAFAIVFAVVVVVAVVLLRLYLPLFVIVSVRICSSSRYSVIVLRARCRAVARDFNEGGCKP